jgi:hypothetical protein
MPRPSSLPPLDLSDAKLSVVAPGVIAERRRTRAGAERSKAQQTLDSLVQVAYEKWVAAGKPENFSERPGGNIRIPESQILQVTRALHMTVTPMWCSQPQTVRSRKQTLPTNPASDHGRVGVATSA